MFPANKYMQYKVKCVIVFIIYMWFLSVFEYSKWTKPLWDTKTAYQKDSF